MISHTVSRDLPPNISTEMLGELLEVERHREILVRQIVRRFEDRYGGSIEALEERLARAEGSEHPDWEDSIEWRNALDVLNRSRALRSLIEWLVRSKMPSLAS